MDGYFGKSRGELLFLKGLKIQIKCGSEYRLEWSKNTIVDILSFCAYSGYCKHYSCED